MTFGCFGNLSSRAPKCQKIKNGGLDQYGTEPVEQQHFGRAGVEGVKKQTTAAIAVQNICATWYEYNMTALY